ncbi:MAG: GNAT family N-acetyltransferase [Burkholderiaceae bacterium]
MMHIRTLQQQDLDELLALYRHLHVNDLPLPERSAVLAIWEEALQNPRCRYFGGYEQDALVSSCTIMVIPNLTRGCRPYGLIENVVTHPDHRGKGWGKLILKQALEHAWSQGCYKVMLFTGRKDESTLRFYDGAGFDRHGKTGFVAKPSEV